MVTLDNVHRSDVYVVFSLHFVVIIIACWQFEHFGFFFWASQGVHRIYEDMPDICIDVPTAYTLLERIANKLHAAGVMSDSLMKDLPSRSVLSVVLPLRSLVSN